MKISNGLLDAKLYELERQYNQTVNHFHLYRQMEHEEVRRDLKQVWQEFRENELLMQKNMAESRSPAAAALSAAQVDYDLAIQRILQNELPGYLHSTGNDRGEDQAEAAGLYAEYAIDFAAQSLRHALLAALWAADLEMSCEERRGRELTQNKTEETPNE